MKATTEMEVKVSGGRIVNAEIMPNGRCKFIVEIAETVAKSIERFMHIKALELSENDTIMKYEPFKSVLVPAIENGILKDFYIPGIDPSFNGKDGVHFVAGEKPAVGKSYNWWNKTAKLFMPERNSRLGTKLEYIAFLAILIKKLVTEKGCSFDVAVSAVIKDSRELGHYRDSADAKDEFEYTGSRDICGICDLANTFKILAYDEKAGGFWLAGGDYDFDGDRYPLASLLNCTSYDSVSNFSVGWLVLSEY